MVFASKTEFNTDTSLFWALHHKEMFKIDLY